MSLPCAPLCQTLSPAAMSFKKYPLTAQGMIPSLSFLRFLGVGSNGVELALFVQSKKYGLLF